MFCRLKWEKLTFQTASFRFNKEVYKRHEIIKISDVRELSRVVLTAMKAQPFRILIKIPETSK